jgi:hypothetical protein
MRRNVLTILGLTALVITLVVVLGPSMTEVSTATPTHAESIPVRTPEPTWRAKPTRPEPTKSIGVVGKAVDSVTSQHLGVRITLIDVLGRTYIPTTDRSGYDGFDVVFRPDYEPQSVRVEVVDAVERYADALIPASVKDGRIDLGVVQFLPPPRVWFWRDAEHKVQCGVIHSYRLSQDTGRVLSEGRTPSNARNGYLMESGHWLVAARNGDSYDFQEVDVVPGANHFVVPERAIVAESLKIVVRTPGGISPPRLEWDIAQEGPHGVGVYVAGGSLSQGESPDCRLVAGTYTIGVKPDYDKEWTTRELVLSEGEQPGPIEFEVADSPCIRVRVTRSGVPVAGKKVRLDQGELERVDRPRMVPTNERGEAYFGGLREWRYYVHGLGQWYDMPSATAKAGEVVDILIDLDRRTGAVVRATLEFERNHADEVPYIAEVVSLEDSSRASVRLKGGKFELRDVPYGRYEFVVRPNSVSASLRRYPFVVTQAEHDFRFELAIRTLTATLPDWVDSDSGFEVYYFQESAEHWVGLSFNSPPIHCDALPPGTYMLCIRQHRKLVAWGTADLTESDCPDVFWHELISMDQWPDDIPHPPFDK